MNLDVDTKRQVKQATQHPGRTIYFDTFAEVPHKVNWADGFRIFVGGDEYVFKRTSQTQIDGGSWYPTGGVLGAVADW